MADTMYYTSTNYFRVTDEEAYKKFYSHLKAEDIHESTKVVDGVVYHSFYGYDCIEYYDTENAVRELFSDHQDNIFDIDGNKLTFEKALKEVELYDEKHKCIFSEYDAVSSEKMVSDIQAILPDGECFIFKEVCHEKLNFIDGYVLVVSNKDDKYISLSSFVDQAVEELVGKNCKVNKF